MEKATKILQSHGVKVNQVSLPEEISNDAASLKRIHKVVMASEAGVVFLKEYEMNKTELASEIRQMVENCGNYTHAERLKAADKLASMRPVIDKLASDYSVILVPSIVDEAPVGLNDMGSAAFNTIWTGFHTPVINIPAFAGDHDMPIGISFVAGRFRDQHLLSISALLSRPLMAEGGWKMEKMEAKLWEWREACHSGFFFFFFFFFLEFGFPNSFEHTTPLGVFHSLTNPTVSL